MVLFSPPYEENPLSHGLRRASSPERGSLVQGNGSCKSSPFRGSWRAAPERVLRGEVEIWYKDFDGMAKKVLSPYGDGTDAAGCVDLDAEFLSPYGDGTTFKVNDVFTTLFSPPYGDGTHFNEVATMHEVVFAPLRGWYSRPKRSNRRDHVFAPLRGWY